MILYFRGYIVWWSWSGATMLTLDQKNYRVNSPKNMKSSLRPLLLKSHILCVLRVSSWPHSNRGPCNIIRKIKCINKFPCNISHLETKILRKFVDCLWNEKTSISNKRLQRKKKGKVLAYPSSHKCTTVLKVEKVIAKTKTFTLIIDLCFVERDNQCINMKSSYLKSYFS